MRFDRNDILMARKSDKKNVYSSNKWTCIVEKIDSFAVTSIAAFVGVMLTVAMSANSIRTNSPNDLFAHIVDMGSGRHFNFVLSSITLPDTNESTEDKYRSKDGTLHGRYKTHRAQLDYTFHSVYSESRVRFQDAIVDSILANPCVEVSNSRKLSTCLDRPEEPWIVFTAGAMGAGKSRTIRLLHQKGLFPLHTFITVDPDHIRQQLPEFDAFVRYNPENAGYLTRKESGLISEIVILEALNRGQNVLVDGTLRDSGWYRRFFQNIRDIHPNLRIAIVHVTSPRQSVFVHAQVRDHFLLTMYTTGS